jgi:hypothetical protein
MPIDRRVSLREYQEALSLARNAGLHRFES